MLDNQLKREIILKILIRVDLEDRASRAAFDP